MDTHSVIVYLLAGYGFLILVLNLTLLMLTEMGPLIWDCRLAWEAFKQDLLDEPNERRRGHHRNRKRATRRRRRWYAFLLTAWRKYRRTQVKRARIALGERERET